MLEPIVGKFHTIRGRKIILDSDLADFYGVTVRHLNSRVSRNQGRFPEDFAFRLTSEEVAVLQGGDSTASPRRKRSNRPPRVFTSIGSLVASSVLNSPKAIEISLQLVREVVAASAHPEFGRDVLSALSDVEWKLAGHPGSPLDTLRAFKKR